METLRQYGQERLRESDDAEETERRHAEYYLALSESVEPDLWVLDRVDVLNRLGWEHDNLRAALAWCREHDAQAGLQLAGNLWRFWYRHDYLNEGRAWLEGALKGALERKGGAGLAKALQGAGTLAWMQGDNVLGRSRLEMSVDMFREAGDRPNLAMSLHFLGHATFDQGDYATGRIHFDESLALYREMGNLRLIYTLVSDLGLVAYHQGDYATARTLFEESLAHFREMQAWSGIANTVIRLGDLGRMENDYLRANELYAESLALAQELGDSMSVASAMHKTGHVVRHQGDHLRAKALFEQSLMVQRQLGNKQGIIECLAGLASVVTVEGLLEEAVTLFGAVDGMLETLKVPLAPADRIDYERDVAAAKTQMEEATWEAAWAKGRAMSMEEAIEYVMRDR